MPAVNLLDLGLALLVALGAGTGWQRGFLGAALDLLSLGAGFAAALAAYAPLAGVFASWQFLPVGWEPLAAFLVLYAGVRLLLGAAAAALLRAVPQRVQRHRLHRALGVLPGTAGGLVHAAVLAMLFLSLPLEPAWANAGRESRIAARLAPGAAWLEARLAPIIDPAVDALATLRTVQPGAHESLALPAAVADAPARPDLEARMLVLVNEARAAQGLAALQGDPEAAEVARAHARDMFARRYFAHVTPEGLDPFDRLRRGGVRFRVAGENLALARNLAMAHQGLMNSPGHRANILRPAFGRVGIGIVDGGRHGIMVVQNFRN